jgi:ABC-type Fe3+ transport system permease subunit
MPTLILLAVMNFVNASGATSSIILLASRDTITLSLMALELSAVAVSNREAASIISIFIIVFTVAGALLVRWLGRHLGIQHGIQANPPGLVSYPQPAAAAARGQGRRA